MKKIVCFLLLFLTLVLFPFLPVNDKTQVVSLREESPNTVSSHYPVVVDTYDAKGVPMQTTFQRAPQRIIVDEVNALETLLILGQGERIVGAALSTAGVSYARLQREYPEEFAKVEPVIQNAIGREQAVALQPDFILAWKASFTPRWYGNTAWWQERGVNTYVIATANHVLKDATVEDECRFIDDMGRIFDRKEQTDALLRDIRTELCVDEETMRRREQQTVLIVEVGEGDILNYDEGWVVGDMVRRLGGRIPLTSKYIGEEELISCDPDVIFVTYNDAYGKQFAENFFRAVRFNSLHAVQNNRIHFVPVEYVYTPAFKLFEGIRAIRRGLYPDE